VRAGAAEPPPVVAGAPVRAPVHIVRDERGIPHVVAANEHDLYFAEGYLQGTDRLFQLDIYRRLVEGRLAEILGTLALKSDLDARVFSIDELAAAQFAALPAAQRDHLAAFAAGVNFAMKSRPLPPEFRVLGYRPEPWVARDSLAASFATVLALTDSWNDVATRADVVAAVGPAARDAFFSISDPAYDAPTAGAGRAPIAPLPPLSIAYPNVTPLHVASAGEPDLDDRAGAGSNEFAAGAARTATHRALLANDPHLELRMPGVWWLADLRAPGLHVAGATLPGVPGIILGHNEHLAWGATNGTVATVAIYRERFRSADSDEYLAGNAFLRAAHRSERFVVRFGKPVVRDYLRTRHGFVFADRGAVKLAAAWTADIDRRSSFVQFDALDRAASTAAAMRALATYPGPPQNFVVADDRGRAGYVLAGEIPIDDAWALGAHDGPSSGSPQRPFVPFARLPHVTPSREAIAFTANARPYGARYPYRLSAAFSPPYRAARIREHLAAGRASVASFEAIQADDTSLPERELAAAGARALAKAPGNDPGLQTARRELARFDGRFDGSSRGAVFVYALRRAAMERLALLHMPSELALRYLKSEPGCAFVAVMRMLRERPHGWVPGDDYDAFLIAAMRDGIADLRAHGKSDATWSDVGDRTAQHPLAALGLGAWNGTRFPGFGDAYSPHVQAPANAQSFRAVWDIGRWDAGGMVIPQGESGLPGSPHYRDLAPTWLAGTLVPFPFGDRAVASAARERFELAP